MYFGTAILTKSVMSRIGVAGVAAVYFMSRLQVTVSSILPSTTAVTGYATGIPTTVS